MRFIHLLCILSLAGLSACSSDAHDVSQPSHSPRKHVTKSKSGTHAKDSGAPNDQDADSSSDASDAGETNTKIADGAIEQPMMMADQAPGWPPSGLPDVKFSMDVNVPAETELHKCLYFAMPDDRGVVAVGGAESHYTPGSHHMLAYRTDLTSIPTEQDGVWDCYQPVGGFHQGGSYYEAQQPDSSRSLPMGVAHEFQPGEVILLESHYINATDKDIDAHVKLMLHTVDLAQVKFEAGTLMFNNITLQIPAHSHTRVTLTCPLSTDIYPALLWSHMHSRGVDFVATSDDEAATRKLGTLYHETNWSEPQPRQYPTEPPVMLHAGTNITVSCDFVNDSDNEFDYGQSAETNEMCILHGMYWPRMDGYSEHCFNGTASSMQF